MIGLAVQRVPMQRTHVTALHFFGMSICKVIYSHSTKNTTTPYHTHSHMCTYDNNNNNNNKRPPLTQYPSQRSKVAIHSSFGCWLLALCSDSPRVCQSIYLQLACCAPLSTTHFIRDLYTHTHTHTSIHTSDALNAVARLRSAFENLCDFSSIFSCLCVCVLLRECSQRAMSNVS